jgi:hypothetical protein
MLLSVQINDLVVDEGDLPTLDQQLLLIEKVHVHLSLTTEETKLVEQWEDTAAVGDRLIVHNRRTKMPCILIRVADETCLTTIGEETSVTLVLKKSDEVVFGMSPQEQRDRKKKEKKK